MSFWTPRYATTFILSAQRNLSQFQEPFQLPTNVGGEAQRAALTPPCPGAPLAAVPENHRERQVLRPRASDSVTDPQGNYGAHLADQIKRKWKLHLFPFRSKVSGSHSYPLLSKKSWRGVYKNDDSSSRASQPHIVLISSRIPAYEVRCISRPAFLSQVVSLTLEDVWLCMKRIHLKGTSSGNLPTQNS